MSEQLHLNVLLFDNFELLDVFGPLEMFSILPEHFKINLVSKSSGYVTSKGGVNVQCPLHFDDSLKSDILLIPGGYGTRPLINDTETIKWIKKEALQHDHVLTVCTGAALLAKTGLLDSHSATTNKLAYDWVTSQHQKVKWKFKPRWVHSGKFWTSAGVSAGTDMSLAFIASTQGQAIAQHAAQVAEYTLNLKN